MINDLLNDEKKENIKYLRNRRSTHMSSIKNFIFDSNQYNSLKNLKVQTDISFRFGEIFNFLISLNIDNNFYKTNALIIITAEYFTVDVDYINYRGAYNIIEDKVLLQDIKRFITENDIPLFVSSLKYGRQLLISIQTNHNFKDLQAKLDINGPSILNIKAFFEKLTRISDIHARFLLRGFPNNSVSKLNLFNIFDVIKTMSICNNCYGDIIYYNLSNISDNSKFTLQTEDQNQAQMNQKIFAKVLYIIPESRYNIGIDFSFFNRYQTNYFFIIPFTITEKQLSINLNDNDKYLFDFDVLILGGVDGKNRYSRFDASMVKKIVAWHESQGWILFLHDFIVGKRQLLFNQFSDYLGYKTDVKSEIFEKAKFVNNKSNAIMTTPHQVFNPMIVSSTHESAQYDENYTVIGALNGAHYYSENSTKRVGDCSVGHSKKISLHEEPFLFNLVYHYATNKTATPLPNDDIKKHTINPNEGSSSQNRSNEGSSSQSRSNDSNISQFDQVDVSTDSDNEAQP